nr:MAG TPA: hypothetical protein [Caudoviricetes sp.]
MSGCTVRGEHLPDCGGVGDGGRGCPGCVPCAASRGCLCSWCWGRACSVVLGLPPLVGHLFDVAGGAGLAASRGGGRRVPGSGCLYPAALGAADDLVAGVWWWCARLAGDLGERVPCPSGLDWAGGPGSGGWPRVVVGVREVGAARVLSGWLGARLEDAAGRPWVGEALGVLSRASAVASARWPVEEPERRVTVVRCPACGCLSLVVCPPRVVGAEEVVVCRLPACGRVLTGREWAALRVSALAAAREGEASRGVGV